MVDPAEQDPSASPERDTPYSGVDYGDPSTWNRRLAYGSIVVMGNPVTYVEVSPDAKPLNGSDIVRYKGALLVSTAVSEKPKPDSDRDPNETNGLPESPRDLLIREYVIEEVIEEANREKRPLPERRPTSLSLERAVADINRQAFERNNPRLWRGRD